MAGRPPTPNEVLKAKGTFRKDRHGKRPEGTGKVPDCPQVLRGEAKREWTRVTKCLKRMKIVDQIDRSLISAYCMAWGKLHRIEKRSAELEEEQEGCKDQKRVEQIDKALWKLECSWSKAFDQLVKTADRLGVGPAARARVKVQEEPELNEFEQFIKGKVG